MSDDTNKLDRRSFMGGALRAAAGVGIAALAQGNARAQPPPAGRHPDGLAQGGVGQHQTVLGEGRRRHVVRFGQLWHGRPGVHPAGARRRAGLRDGGDEHAGGGQTEERAPAHLPRPFGEGTERST